MDGGSAEVGLRDAAYNEKNWVRNTSGWTEAAMRFGLRDAAYNEKNWVRNTSGWTEAAMRFGLRDAATEYPFVVVRSD
jgi:hypothetical protein